MRKRKQLKGFPIRSVRFIPSGMQHVSDMLNKSACASSWWTNYWKHLITLASTLVTPFGATPSLEAMLTPRTHALDGGLRGETWQATNDPNIKFLSG
jgi:hypothetical protein